MSGLEVQKELQAVSPKTRVIIMTGNKRRLGAKRGDTGWGDPISINLLTTTFLAAVHQAMARES